MSEENKWRTGLPDDDKNASAEQKPLTHPYSEGRRMQESGQNSDTGAGQSEGASQEKTKYGHYEVHQPQAGNYAPIYSIMPVEIYRQKSRGKRGIFQETTALERKRPLLWRWL